MNWQSIISYQNGAQGPVKSIVIIGMGETGQSCLRFLDSPNVSISVMDSRTRPDAMTQLVNDYPNVKFTAGGFDQQQLLDADLIVLSPGVSIDTPEIGRARQAGVVVIGDIELFARQVELPVISITGSNGKSTVTALTGELLKAAGIQAMVGGNIGLPALDLLSQPADMYVLELSSFQLESTSSLNSAAAVILNITPDHLDRYASLDEYAAAKRQIFKNARTVVFNRNDDWTRPDRDKNVKAISFGLDAPENDEDFGLIEHDGRLWLGQGKSRLVCVDEMLLKGRHNQLNALAALALVFLAGKDPAKVVSELVRFKGLPHRFEYVGSWQGVEWINDSKGTNPGATLAAISGQEKPIVLIIGGDSKGADFSVLAEAIQTHVKAIVLFGRDAYKVEEIVSRTLPCLCANDLAQAVQIADDFSSVDNIVLFSPACASFDRYKNYMQRGDSFKQKIKEHFQ